MNKKTQLNGIGTGKPGPGRPPGALNKTTAELRSAILLAGEQVGDEIEQDGGLQAYLAKLARTHPQTFATLLSKLLPAKLAGEDLPRDTGPIMVGWISDGDSDNATEQNRSGGT